VGFPGETDVEFAETVGVCRQAGFSKIHIFPFSARRGTPAATMPGQLPKHVKQERLHELASVEAELRDAYFATLRGMQLRVLVESPLERAGSSPTPASTSSPTPASTSSPTPASTSSPTPASTSSPTPASAPSLIGTSCRYAPVEIPADSAPLGDFVTITAGDSRSGHIFAQAPAITAAARSHSD
jgi:hypothetical protein